MNGCKSVVRPARFSFLYTLRPTFLVFAIAFLFSSGAANLHGQIKYDPEHPEVQRMIGKAIDFMVENQSNLIGNRVMMGMATYKANILRSTTPKKHELIDKAVASIYERCTENALRNSAEFSKMYASALACIFLIELDSEKHKQQIEILLDHIVERQQASGAWGYRSYAQVGDTSQMQYIALALWSAIENGFRVDPEIAKRALDWMCDTQQGGGGWIYQTPAGVMPTAFGPDREIRHSLVAAGLGTVYLYSDMLRLNNRDPNARLKMMKKLGELDLPPAVQDITKDGDQQTTVENRNALVSFDGGKLRSTISQGNSWFRSNFTADPNKYGMYFLYGFERYASLREYVEGDMAGIEDWYDQGVEHLMRIQTDFGNFPGDSGDISDSVKTAFGILFLTRSMQLVLGDKAVGRLRGHEGFKTDAVLTEQGGRIVHNSVERSVKEFLKLLEDPENDELKFFVESLEKLQMEGDNASKSQQLATMRMLVRHPKFDARYAAVKFLGNQRNLDNVPALIYALTDPDPFIAIQANRGLKYVSRKTSGYEISDKPTKSEVDALKQRWTEWYLHVRPGASLLDEKLNEGDD